MPTPILHLLLFAEFSSWFEQHFISLLSIAVVILIATGGAIVRSLFQLSSDMRALQKSSDMMNEQLLAHIDDTSVHVTEREMDGLKITLRDMEGRFNDRQTRMDAKLDYIIEKM